MAFEWNTDVANAPVNDKFAAIPAGTYRAIIADVQDKPTKAGGAMLSIELHIHGGSYDSRRVWDNLNYENPNPTAVRLAFQTLKAIGEALSLPEKFAPTDLLDKMLLIDLIVDPKDTSRNKVRKYKPDSYNAPVAGRYSPSESRDESLPF